MNYFLRGPSSRFGEQVGASTLGIPEGIGHGSPNPHTETETYVRERGLSETRVRDCCFKTTHWSVVLEAGQNDSPGAATALGRLCQIYWYPLYAYVRRSGHSPEDAQDLTQEFFARLIAKEHLQGLEPHKGKFRCFLVVALKRFLVNEWERAHRLKRGGGQNAFSLNEPGAEEHYQSEFVDHKTPEKLLDQCWATALLEQALGRLSTEMHAQGKGLLFHTLKVFLGGYTERKAYTEAACRLGMTEGTLRVNIHRLRQRYRELLRLEIASTVDSPEAVDEEIRDLFAALS